MTVKPTKWQNKILKDVKCKNHLNSGDINVLLRQLIRQIIRLCFTFVSICLLTPRFLCSLNTLNLDETSCIVFIKRLEKRIFSVEFFFLPNYSSPGVGGLGDFVYHINSAGL